MSASGGDPMGSFAMGFLAVMWGALAVVYAKYLESGSRNHPRSSPHPLTGLVRLAGALFFFAGLYLIGRSAWFLLTHPAARR